MQRADQARLVGVMPDRHHVDLEVLGFQDDLGARDREFAEPGIAKAAADLLPSEVNASAVPLSDETPFVHWLTTNFTSEKYGIVRLTVSHSFFLRSVPMRWETMKKSLIQALVNATKG